MEETKKKLLMPLMNLRYLETCLGVFESISKENIESYISSGKNGNDLRTLFSKITFDIILKTVIGIDYRQNYEFLDQAITTLTHFVTKDKYRFFSLFQNFLIRKSVILMTRLKHLMI